MPKLTMGKTRPTDKPYLTVAGYGGFTYNVLKAYSADPDKPYARWFLATKSPFTYGSWELGDGYIADVFGAVTYKDPAVTDADLPLHLKGGSNGASAFDRLIGY